MAFTTVTKLETIVPIAAARETNFRKLVGQGYISGHATQDKTHERMDAGPLPTFTKPMPLSSSVTSAVTCASSGTTIIKACASVTPPPVVWMASCFTTAEVKLKTFLYTRYGTVQAQVNHVTADAVSVRWSAPH